MNIEFKKCITMLPNSAHPKVNAIYWSYSNSSALWKRLPRSVYGNSIKSSTYIVHQCYAYDTHRMRYMPNLVRN